MKNNFYVYEWYNIENGEVFYVGKGSGYRYKNLYYRNQYFKNYYNKHNCDVRKVKVNLDENEAFEIEKELIKTYKNINQCQCNLTIGGEGSRFLAGSWHDLFKKLSFLYNVQKRTRIMSNEEDYFPENLKEKTVSELEELLNDYRDSWDGLLFFNSLDIYDDNNEDLEIGWECFEDY